MDPCKSKTETHGDKQVSNPNPILIFNGGHIIFYHHHRQYLEEIITKQQDSLNQEILYFLGILKIICVLHEDNLS